MIRILLFLIAAFLGPASADEPDAIDPEADAAAAAEIASAPGLTEPPLFDPPDPETAERRTEQISGGLRCPVCQGLSVSDSNADAARAMHTRIAELVAQGYSEDQIVDYFVGRYGAWVRLEPPREGLNWIIWVGPVVLFVLGAGVVASQVGGAPEDAGPLSPQDGAVAPPRKPATGEQNHRDRILAELGEVGSETPAPDHRARILAELGGDEETNA